MTFNRAGLTKLIYRSRYRQEARGEVGHDKVAKRERLGHASSVLSGGGKGKGGVMRSITRRGKKMRNAGQTDHRTVIKGAKQLPSSQGVDAEVLE